MDYAGWLILPYKVLQVYTRHCKELCAQIQLPQTAFDILVFLANNPEKNTARDVSQRRGIKANLVSLNVDKLVSEGYLERQADAGDRRKVLLLCTQKAQPIIAQGRILQKEFMERLFQGIDGPEYNQFLHTIDTITTNLERMERK